MPHRKGRGWHADPKHHGDAAKGRRPHAYKRKKKPTLRQMRARQTAEMKRLGIKRLPPRAKAIRDLRENRLGGKELFRKNELGFTLLDATEKAYEAGWDIDEIGRSKEGRLLVHFKHGKNKLTWEEAPGQRKQGRFHRWNSLRDRIAFHNKMFAARPHEYRWECRTCPVKGSQIGTGKAHAAQTYNRSIRQGVGSEDPHEVVVVHETEGVIGPVHDFGPG